VGLWASEEDKIEASFEVVGLKASSDGGGDLERGLSEGDGGEGGWSRGDQANCLYI
jgi:hypothetical protein